MAITNTTLKSILRRLKEIYKLSDEDVQSRGRWKKEEEVEAGF